MTLRLTAARSNQLSYRSFPNFKPSARSGIRTHEAEARDLETRPFDRSGIRAGQMSLKRYDNHFTKLASCCQFQESNLGLRLKMQIVLLLDILNCAP